MDKTTVFKAFIVCRPLIDDQSRFVNLFHLFQEERARWFLWTPVLMACGIVLYFALSFEPPPLAVLAAPVFCAACFLSFRAFPFIRVGASAVFFVALGLGAAQVETLTFGKPVLKAPLSPIGVTGTLMRAEALPEGSRLTLKRPSLKDVAKEDRPLFLRIKTRTALADLPPAGSRVNIWGALWPPADPALPDGYDFRRQAFFKQIGGTGISYVEPTERESRYPLPLFWDGFLVAFENARRALTLMTFARLDDPQERAMTAALLSGSQLAIDDEVMNAMRASGLAHLLSISGIHVSMMGFLVYVPLRFFLALIPWIALRFPVKKWAAGAAILATSLYALLVGADAPTVRSALMTGLVMLAIIADRRALSLRLVALAALTLMLIAPSVAMGASFQMSFAAVLAMVAAYEKKLDAVLKEGLAFPLPHGIRLVARYVKDIVLTSLLATAATTPFTLFHFQTFNFYGVLANVLAIPLTTLWIMPCLLLTYCAAPFGAAELFLDGTGWGSGLLIALAKEIAGWPFAQIALPQPPAAALIAFLIGGLWLCLWQKLWRFAGLLPMLGAFFYPLFVETPSVLIASDAPVWAVRLPNGALAVWGKRKENFIVAQWCQRLGNPETLYFSAKNPPLLDQGLFCDGKRCLYEKDGVSILFLTAPPPEGQPFACPATPPDVIVAFTPLPPCAGTRIIDVESLHRHGAHALFFEQDGSVSVQTVRPAPSQRPWQPIETPLH